MDVSLPEDIEAIIEELATDYRGIHIETVEHLRSVSDQPHPLIIDLSQFCNEACGPEEEENLLTPDQKKALLDQVVRKLTTLFDIVGVDVILLPHVALFMGSLVEIGADPELALGKLLKLLETTMPKATKVVSVLHQREVDYVESLGVSYDLLEQIVESGEVTIEDVKSWRQLKFLVLPVMTMISRSLRMRQRLRRDTDFKKALYAICDAEGERTSMTSSTYYIKEVLDVEEEIEVVVLHPETNEGCIVQTIAIQNCFHFFTLLQDALSSKQWNQQMTLPLAIQQGAVRTARSEEESASKYYDGNQWSYYHWTGFHEPSGANEINGYLKPSQLLTLPTPGSEPSRIVLLMDYSMKSKQPARWHANLFNPIHSALRSDVRIIRELSSEEVNKYVTSMRQLTYLPTPPAPIRAVSAEDQHELSIKLYTMSGLRVMVDIIKQRFPDKNPVYDKENNCVRTDFNNIIIKLKILSLKLVMNKAMIAQCWEAVPSPNWTQDGLQVVLIGLDDIPDEAMRKGGNEWFDGTFICLLNAIYFNSPDTFATLATSNGMQTKPWVAYRGMLQIQSFGGMMNEEEGATEEEKNLLRTHFEEKLPSITQILLQTITDFIAQRDIIEDHELIWIKMYLGRHNTGEFNGEIVVNNTHLIHGQQILQEALEWPEALNQVEYIAFRQFFVVRSLISDSRR